MCLIQNKYMVDVGRTFFIRIKRIFATFKQTNLLLNLIKIRKAMKSKFYRESHIILTFILQMYNFERMLGILKENDD